MEKEFKVSCPRCKAVFFVPVELGGESAECGECDFVFEIPKPDETENYEVTETGTISGVELDDMLSHSTVKLSRSSIGMIPTIKERFELAPKPVPNPKS